MKKFLFISIALTYLIFACKKSSNPTQTNTLDSGPDTTPPVITLVGQSTYYISLENYYIEYGATAIDNKDGDISKLLTRTGSVNIALAGTYTLAYNVQDAAGNKVDEKIRTILIRNDIDKLKLDGNYTCFRTCDQNTASVTTSTANLTASKTKNNYITINPNYSGIEIELQNPNMYFPSFTGHVTGLISNDGKTFTITTRWGDINNPTSYCVDVYRKNE